MYHIDLYHGIVSHLQIFAARSGKGRTKRLVKSGDAGNTSLSIRALMDVLAAGKMVGPECGGRYRVKTKLAKESISPHIRTALCGAVARGGGRQWGRGRAKEEGTGPPEARPRVPQGAPVAGEEDPRSIRGGDAPAWPGVILRPCGPFPVY